MELSWLQQKLSASMRSLKVSAHVRNGKVVCLWHLAWIMPRTWGCFVLVVTWLGVEHATAAEAGLKLEFVKSATRGIHFSIKVLRRREPQ